MFSAANCLRLCAPRPPEPIIAMFSLSFRLRPRTTAGAANAPTAAPATVRTNCRRLGRDSGRPARDEEDEVEGEDEFSIIEGRAPVGGLRSIDAGRAARGEPIPPRALNDGRADGRPQAPRSDRQPSPGLASLNAARHRGHKVRCVET